MNPAPAAPFPAIPPEPLPSGAARPARLLVRLLPAILAVLTALLLLVGLEAYARHQTHRHVLRLAAFNFPENTRGLALQRQVFGLRRCLPIYGSSELDILQPTRADLFFHGKGTGFRAIVIGQAGDRCLLMLQNLAALGDTVRGRKVAIFLSPIWFQSSSKPSPETAYEHGRMAANFSPLQTGRTLADSPLKLATRSAVAARMLDYDEIVLERSPLLHYALTGLGATHPAWLGRAGFYLLRPLLSLQNVVLSLQDSFHQLELIHKRPAARAGRHPSGRPFRLRHKLGDWDSLLAEISHAQDKQFRAESPDGKRVFLPKHPKTRRSQSPDALADPDAEFRRRLAASTEWDDLELLLKTLRELKARPLLIGQPFNGLGDDLQGISAESRRLCYDRLAQVAARHHVALQDFSAYERDDGFFRDMVHPSAKAWVYYDEALSDFYHGKHH